MVKKIAIITVMFFALPVITQARSVKNIEIIESGAIYDGEDNIYEKEACKSFIPEKKQLITFFKLAEESKENRWLHDYYSAYISYGSVQFKDGQSAKWTLQSSGLASVILNDGSSVYFFYKDNAWKDPNACTYGLGDEPNPDPGC